MTDLIVRMIQKLEYQFAESKGGNVRGVTEDHRYEMLKQLRVLRAAEREANKAGGIDGR